GAPPPEMIVEVAEALLPVLALPRNRRAPALHQARLSVVAMNTDVEGGELGAEGARHRFVVFRDEVGPGGVPDAERLHGLVVFEALQAGEGDALPIPVRWEGGVGEVAPIEAEALDEFARAFGDAPVPLIGGGLGRGEVVGVGLKQGKARAR